MGYYGKSYLQKARRSVQQHSGFIGSDLRELRQLFNQCREEGTGLISLKKLHVLLARIFPNIVSNSTIKPQFDEHVENAHSNMDGTLGFHEFLSLLRQGEDLLEQDRRT